MTPLVQCRCPDCSRICGEAGEGSTVRLQCDHDKIRFSGRVINGRFVVERTFRRQMQSAGPPRYIG